MTTLIRPDISEIEHTYFQARAKFNTVSIALTGRGDLATVLRLRIALDTPVNVWGRYLAGGKI